MIIFNKKMFKVSLILVIIILLFWLLKEFNFNKVYVDEDSAKIHINFILPMDKQSVKDNILIFTDIKEGRFDCDIEWKSSTKVLISLKEKDIIKGKSIKLSINKAKTKLPFIKKNIVVPVDFKAMPQIVEISNTKNLPTDSSVWIQFNTPMKNTNINKYIQSDGNFEIIPVPGTSNSKWQLKPKNNLANNRKYILYIKKGMESISGFKLDEDIVIDIETTTKPDIISISPDKGESGVGIYPIIEIECSEPIESAKLSVDNTIIDGDIIKDNKARFYLKNILDFETSYNIRLEAISVNGEKSDRIKSEFTTIDYDSEKVWVEVILRKRQRVKIYKGRKLIKTMICSGGTKEDPTILGTYYIKDRGPRFFAKKISEGATNWVRINGNYLFHGIPRDKDWNINQDAKNKLGTAASHGCIRLSEEDSKWFYDNIPQNTMVIIHE